MGHNYHKWQSAIDREIQKAIQDGRSTDLPGAGKPLELRDDPNTPADMRMAYKIMRDNDIAPEWIAMGKALEQAETRIRRALMTALKAGQHLQEKRWLAVKQKLQQMVDDYNNQILSYNLKVPPGVRQRPQILLERAIEKALADL